MSDETIDNFIDNLIEAVLKPGQKVELNDKLLKHKLTPAAIAALKSDPKTEAERKAVEIELEKHAQEYEKMNALLNKMRKKKEALESKKNKLSTTLTEADVKYFSLIENDCSDFLKYMKKAGRMLFRGMDSNGKVIYGRSHEKRSTMDTSENVQKRFDELLKVAGFKALRSNSIFTSGDMDHAENYGDPYMIFPKNGFNYTWSEEHADWVPDEDNVYFDSSDEHEVREFLNEMDEILNNPDLDDDDGKAEKEYKAKLKIPEYKKLVSLHKKLYNKMYDLDMSSKSKIVYKTDLEQFLNLLKSTYKKFKIDVSMSDINHIISISGGNDTKFKVSKQMADTFVKENRMRKTDLDRAMKMGHEVYISGEYIALVYDTYKIKAAKYFLNKNVTSDNDF